MKNSIENLGEKIRIERLRSNMTQAQLAENIVSRNMLCMIESGRTLPSIETVTALANRLNIPLGLLLCTDEATEALYTKIGAVSKAKALFSEKRYSECADMCSTVPFDDEMTAMMAECYLKIAEEDMKKCMLTSASRNLEIAMSISKNTLYLGEDFTGTIEAYNFIISCAEDKINADRLGRICRIKSRIQPSMLAYLSVLSKIDEGNFDEADNITDSFPFLTKEAFQYLKAKKLIREFRFAAALDILLTLEAKESLDFITKYRVYADIELCYENKRDFEKAYKYSTLKHHTLECFRN